MQLTPEQIRQAQQKYQIGGQSTQNNASQRIAEMRNSLGIKQEVEDYKQTPKGKSFLQKGSDFFGKFLGAGASFITGAGKGALSTASGAAELGQRAMRGTARALLPEAGEKLLGIQEKEFQPSTIPDKFTTPEGTAEKAGFITEQIAEFLIPGSKVAKAEKGFKLGVRAATESAIIGGQTAIQQGEINENTKTAAIIGGLFPVGGAIGKKLLGFARPLGRKIQMSVIKPSKKDITDGFSIANINKHKLGGTLEETATQTHIKLNQLGKKLQSTLKGSDEAVNLISVFDDTVDDLLQVGKSKQFGEIKSTKRVLDSLKAEIDEVANGREFVNLVDATNIKRGAGTKGSWAFGRVEPDAGATEKVYSKFYSKIKNAIEKASPENIKGINKQISELIPISNAVIRRLPVSQRNNVLSLTDSIGLFASAFDPRALVLVGASRLSKSGKFGSFLANLGKKEPTTAVGQRIFGGSVDDLSAGLSIQDVSKKIGADDLNVMSDFTDYVAGSYKPGEKLGQQLELDASRIAEKYGITLKKTTKGLADQFGRVLEMVGFTR